MADLPEANELGDWIEQRNHALMDLACVMAALELGLPEALHHPRSPSALADILGVPPDRLSRLTDALCWLGILRTDGTDLQLTSFGRQLFSEDAARWQIASTGSSASSWMALAETLRSGQPAPSTAYLSVGAAW